MARASTELSTKVRGHRWHVLAGTMALGALALTAGWGYVSPTAVSADDSHGDAAIVECRSGIVTDGDVQTSSIVVTRVDVAPPSLPGGCSVTP
jgi:hypothetical protein